MMIARIVTWVRTLLMMVKMWCGFIRRGVKKRETLELEEFSWLDLPTDVVKSIFPRLRYEDQARFACVCKHWRDINKTEQPFYPVGKTPLLIHVKSKEEGEMFVIFHYYSPFLNKTFQVKCFLDLRGYEIISVIHGALLIYNKDEMLMRMVDPMLDYSNDFPQISSHISFNGTAIGVHRKSYVMFLIDTSHENQVTMHLYHRGIWTLDLVYDNGNEPFYLSSNPVYFDGRFYCLSTKGNRIGIFDLLEWTWNVYSVEFMNKYDEKDDIHGYCCYYLVGWINTVMAVRVKNNGSRIQLFLLDRKKMVWKETVDLCGRSLFLGSSLSVMSLPTTKRLQNKIFLPHSHQDEPKTVIVADLEVYLREPMYFSAESSVSSEEEKHAATTICCCNNSGEESQYLGSTQNQKYCTIWYEPWVEWWDEMLESVAEPREVQWGQLPPLRLFFYPLYYFKASTQRYPASIGSATALCIYKAGTQTLCIYKL